MIIYNYQQKQINYRSNMKKIDFNTVDFEGLKISDLKRMADYWMRQYLLARANRNGYNQILCPLKNKWYSEDYIQASHFIDRSCMNTRYDLDNVTLISSHSNMWDAQESAEGFKSKHHKDYSEYLGEKKVQELFDKSKIIRIFARQDYIDNIIKFREGCPKKNTPL